jgi:ATPase subunit of ABC transporter with duplicated ATPase domains
MTLQTVEVVEEVVKAYKGVLLVVSHGETNEGTHALISHILSQNHIFSR